MIPNVKEFFKNFTTDSQLLLHLTVSLVSFWIVFDTVKFLWADDPVQKVILAPLGEEPFKLIMGLLLFTSVLVGLYLPQLISTKTKKMNLSIATLFSYLFVPFAIIAGILFGITEGPLNNIVSHFSMTTIGSILFVSMFMIIKDKSWKNGYKILAVFSTLSIPMLMHSIHNQYANIGYADNHQGFTYLVSIAKYLQDHTVLVTQSAFTSFEFKIAFIVLFIWIIIRIICPLFYTNKLSDS
jgi:hypothetical protein